MASQNSIRLSHVIGAGLALLLFLSLLAVHTVAWWEPQVPLDKLYPVYFPFHWFAGLYLGGLVALWMGLLRLFPTRPQDKGSHRYWAYMAFFTFFVTYYCACQSQ